MKNRNQVLIYAHRANRGLMPEQTLPAYQNALEIGCDYVDMDINMTKDGVLVITHDLYLNPNLTRDSNGNWINDSIPIYFLNYEELKKYNVGKLKEGTSYAKYFPNQKPLGFAEIPKLTDIIKYVKNIAGDKVGFQIEIKNSPEYPQISPPIKEYVKALYNILKEEDILNRVEIQSFDWQCLIELNKIDRNVKTAYLTDYTTVSLTDNEKGKWTAGYLPKKFSYSLPKMIKELGGYCWEPFQNELTKELLDEAKELGLKVVVWGWPEVDGTEFNYDKINKMIDWGVDGIITDRSDLLKEILILKGYEVPTGLFDK